MTTRLHSRQSVLNRKYRVLAEIMTGSRSAFAWTDRGVMKSMSRRHGLAYPSLSVFGKYTCREMSSTSSHLSGCARTETGNQAASSARSAPSAAMWPMCRGAATCQGAVDANGRHLLSKNRVSFRIHCLVRSCSYQLEQLQF